jgi:hypothetical protein
MPIVPTPLPENALPPARDAGTHLHDALWVRFGGVLAGCAFAMVAYAGAQQEEQLSDSVRTAMCKALSVPSETERLHGRQPDVLAWLNDMSPRLASRMPDARDRIALLTTVHYESARAGLDPQLVLGLIHHESAFKRYAVSSAGALGYMQVMPFWLKQLGEGSDRDSPAPTPVRHQGEHPFRHGDPALLPRHGERRPVPRAGRYNGSLAAASTHRSAGRDAALLDLCPAQGR